MEQPMTYEEALTAYVELIKQIITEPLPGHPSVEVKRGRSFDKVVTFHYGAHSFIAKKDNTTKTLGTVKCGDILKAKTWKQPAKNARGNIFDTPSDALTPGGHIRYMFELR
jgi:hypothetical protein